MLKTLLAATTALTLTAGVSFAQTTYSDSTTRTTTGVATPLGDVDVTKTTRSSTDHDGVISEKDKTVTKDTDISSNGDVTKKRTETTTIR
jgi:hypothetical protein